MRESRLFEFANRSIITIGVLDGNPIVNWIFSFKWWLTISLLAFPGGRLVVWAFMLDIWSLEILSQNGQTKNVGYVFRVNWSFFITLVFPAAFGGFWWLARRADAVMLNFEKKGYRHL